MLSEAAAGSAQDTERVRFIQYQAELILVFEFDLTGKVKGQPPFNKPSWSDLQGP